ncbi:MAG TPA: RDD family protein [Nevskiaceae bacterium]|nr:RDD family protein [Nevskiaceae bacterium]
MSTILPAPLWRRLVAGVYDGLLLIGIWMAGSLVEVIVRDQLLGLPKNDTWLQVYFFVLGLAFFGWFWVRGGQTLGMRAWRLQLRRLDGAGLRWTLVPLRFTVMLGTWFAACSSLALIVPRYRESTYAHEIVVVATLAALGCAVLILVDARRRAYCDLVAGTEVVVLPRKDAVAATVET